MSCKVGCSQQTTGESLQNTTLFLDHSLLSASPVRRAGVSPTSRDDGGWSRPAHVTAIALAAVAAAVAHGATGGCDVDVVRVGDINATLFVQEYLVPARPVLIRGLGAGVASSWRKDEFVSSHGSVPVNPAEIPYASTFGVAAPTELPLRAFVKRLLSCSESSAGQPTAPRCVPFVGSDEPVAGGRIDADGSISAVIHEDVAQSTEMRRAPYVFNRLRRDGDPATRALLGNLTTLPPFLSDARVPTWPPSQSSTVPLIPSAPGAVSVELYIGGPGSGAPMHFHGDACN